MFLRSRNRQDEEQGQPRRRWGILRRGSRGVVIKGKSAHIGETATITAMKAVMIDVVMEDLPDEAPCRKRKDSLLFLGDGLEVKRDRRGNLWVTLADSPRVSEEGRSWRRTTPTASSESEERPARGIVVEEDESDDE